MWNAVVFVLTSPLYALAWFIITFIWYIAGMNILAHKDELLKLGLVPKVIYGAILIAFLPLDWGLNMVVGTAMFLEKPKSFKELFTRRLQRWEATDTKRGWVARWICKNLLNPFDKDGHC